MTDFESVYRTYFNDVYRYILKLSGDENIAEEITSETFFKALKCIGSFRGDCEIRIWLCRIAKNCFISYIERAKRTVSLDADDFPEISSPERTPEEQTVMKDDVSRIRAALRKLPEPYKEVFTRRVFARMSFGEIGALFRKSANWACVTYHRAKNMIRSETENKK